MKSMKASFFLNLTCFFVNAGLFSWRLSEGHFSWVSLAGMIISLAFVFFTNHIIKNT